MLYECPLVYFRKHLHIQMLEGARYLRRIVRFSKGKERKFMLLPTLFLCTHNNVNNYYWNILLESFKILLL